MTPTPHSDPIQALADAPPPEGRAQAKADIDPLMATQYTAPEADAPRPPFDPFAFPNYDGPDGYTTAWCVADLEWQSHRGTRPPPYINPKTEWLRLKAEHERKINGQ